MNPTILVVDDDSDIRDIVTLELTARGLGVVAAASGAEALVELKRHAIDLVVLDIQMPEMSGIETCREIRRSSDVPVVFLSSLSELGDRVEGLNVGADDYVTKPFAPEELVARIGAVLRRTSPARDRLGRKVFEISCSVCHTCLSNPKKACPECGSEPPGTGWPPIDEIRMPYLGMEVDSRYVLDRFIGAGGMGSVYRAHSRALDRDFACKIIETEGGQEGTELLRRFRLEIDALSKLRNPHTVSIYESMKLGPNTFGFVMDYVRGKTMQELLDVVGRFSTGRTLRLLRQVANGLHEAHEIGLVHRDLKPDNIMVERLPASGYFARILDFGIVHIRSVSGATQGFFGTPLFSSPEQCLGESIDRRSDVYSLGCVAFYCLTGKLPFEAKTALKIMEKHVNQAPPTLAESLGKPVSPELERFIGSLLEKSAADRPADMKEVIAVIDAILATVTGDEPEVEEGESDAQQSAWEVGVAGEPRATSSPSRVLAPLQVYRLPAAVAASITAFTAFDVDAAGRYAVVADQQNRVHVVPLRGQDDPVALHGASGSVIALDVDAENRSVVAGQVDGSLWRWRLDRPTEPRHVADLAERTNAVAAAAVDHGVLVGTDRGRLFEIRSGQPAKQLQHWTSPVRAFAWVEGAGSLLVALGNGGLVVVDVRTGATRDLADLPAPARAIAASPDGYLFAVLDENDDIRILDSVLGRVAFTVHAEVASLRALAFDAAGRLLGIGALGTQIGLWEVDCGVPRRT